MSRQGGAGGRGSGARRAVPMPSPVLLPLASLKSHPRNYRIHPPDQLAHLEESIRTHGFYRNVVASRDGTILVGHGVVMAAARLGMDEVPVITLDMDSTDPRALLLMAADNEIGRLAQTDNAALSKLLESLAKPGPESLMGTGYDAMKLSNLVAVAQAPMSDRMVTEAQEWFGMPEYHVVPKPVFVAITFHSIEDRRRFAEELGLRVTDRTRGTFWPQEQNMDLRSVKFKSTKHASK